MKMTRRILLPLLLFSVFLFGCLGHLWARQPAVAEVSYHITFVSEKVNNTLLFSLPEEGAFLRFGEIGGTLLSKEAEPSRLLERERGVTRTYESCLYSTVRFTLLLSAHEKAGRLYVGATSLPLGETGLLTGENFALWARFSHATTDF